MDFHHPLLVIRVACYLLAVAVLWLLGVTFKNLTDMVRFR